MLVKVVSASLDPKIPQSEVLQQEALLLQSLETRFRFGISRVMRPGPLSSRSKHC